MRKLLLLLLIVAVAAIALYRQRLFLRDPLGKMYANQAEVAGARVFINYSNDVLVQTGATDTPPQLIVQGWDRMPGVPQAMTCLRAMVCLTTEEHAPKSPLEGPNRDARTTMSNRNITFIDGKGQSVLVILR